MSKQLLLGDEAIAQAALDAGLSGVYAYPGTPSTEITEYIQMAPITSERNIHNRWCANEKTAMEAALGMSFVGKRALVCMKHVGMNVAADCFINSAITGVKGGLIVVAADDPSMHSSQNEQHQGAYAAAENCLLAKEVCFRFCAEGGLKESGSCSANGKAICQRTV